MFGLLFHPTLSSLIIDLVEDEAEAAFIWHCYIPAVEKLRVKQLKNYICA